MGAADVPDAFQMLTDFLSADEHYLASSQAYGDLGLKGLNDALDIFLLWHPADDAVTVRVEDLRTGVRIEMEVDQRDALAAFKHPFAYAP